MILAIAIACIVLATLFAAWVLCRAAATDTPDRADRDDRRDDDDWRDGWSDEELFAWPPVTTNRLQRPMTLGPAEASVQSLPPEWRISPVPAAGGCEARRLAIHDEHPFGGLALQGTREQCLAAALIVEHHGRRFDVEPLRRKAIRA
jgi:hypothetical protein